MRFSDRQAEFVFNIGGDKILPRLLTFFIQSEECPDKTYMLL